MMTAEKPKRRWFAFWMLPVIPRCPVHGVPCVCRGHTASGGMQKRYCPVAGCSHSVKTPIPKV